MSTISFSVFIGPDAYYQKEYDDFLSSLDKEDEIASKATLAFSSHQQQYDFNAEALAANKGFKPLQCYLWLKDHQSNRILASIFWDRDPVKPHIYLAYLSSAHDDLQTALDKLLAEDSSENYVFFSTPHFEFNNHRQLNSSPELTSNLYTNGALFYERDLTERSSKDLPFYLNITRTLQPNSILEMACGTGRLTLPLIEAGYRVTAFDHSQAMLSILKNRLRYLPAILRRNLELSQDNLISYKSKQKYDLILIPFRSLMMLKQEQVIACLQICLTHLKPNGSLVFDLIKAPIDDALDLVTNEHLVWRELNEMNEDQITKKESSYILHNDPLCLSHHLIWEYSLKNGGWQRYEDNLVYTFHSSDWLLTLVQSLGLNIHATYNSFNGQEQGDELIVHARYS